MQDRLSTPKHGVCWERPGRGVASQKQLTRISRPSEMQPRWWLKQEFQHVSLERPSKKTSHLLQSNSDKPLGIERKTVLQNES